MNDYEVFYKIKSHVVIFADSVEQAQEIFDKKYQGAEFLEIKEIVEKRP